MRIDIEKSEWKSGQKAVTVCVSVGIVMLLIGAIIGFVDSVRGAENVFVLALWLFGMYFVGVYAGASFFLFPPKKNSSRSKYMTYTEDE